MKRIVVGKNAEGLSCVVSEGDPPRSWQYAKSSEHAPHFNPRTLTKEPFGAAAPSGAWIAELWTTRPLGAEVVGEDPAGYTEEPGVASLDVPAGVARFSVASYGPGYESKMHHTDSIDFDICISGQLDLVLEAEVVRMEPGDVAILHAARHAWRTETGGSFAFVMLSPYAYDGSEEER